NRATVHGARPSFPPRRSSDLDGCPLVRQAFAGPPARLAVAAALHGAEDRRRTRAERQEEYRRATVAADGDGEPARLPEQLVAVRSEEHTSELQSREKLVCRLL